jgi:hypothetical protein
MMSNNECLKRTYDHGANYDNASVQGISEPHNRSYGHHDSLNAKRLKTSALKNLDISDFHKGPWNPLQVHEQPKTTWSSGTESFPATLGTLHPRWNNSFPASMSNVSESSWSQALSENSYSVESDQGVGHGQACSPWKGSTPTTWPHTIRSSPSRTENGDVEFNFDRSIESSNHAIAVSAHGAPNATHVTGNPDWLAGLGLPNNWYPYSANSTSHDVSRHRVSGPGPSSETLLEAQDTHREHQKRQKAWNTTDKRDSRAHHSRQV